MRERAPLIFKALAGSPMDGIISVDSRATRTIEKEISIPKADFFSVESSRKNFGLTPLEKEVIGLTVAGNSNEESARTIGIGEPDLRLRLTSICDKLGVSNQFELILFALYHQLIGTKEISPHCY